MVKKSVNAAQKAEIAGYVSAANFKWNEPRVLSTGIIALDMALQIGGFPTGTVVRLKGQESVGKSTTSFALMKNALDIGMGVMLVDSELSYDPKRAFQMGITSENNAKMFISKPTKLQPQPGVDVKEVKKINGITIEQMINDLDYFITLPAAENGFLLVIDSYDFLTSNNRNNATEDHALMADKVNVLTRWFPRLKAILKAYDGLAVFIHQARANLTPMNHTPIIYSGGFALKHGSDLDIELVGMGKIKDSTDQAIGKSIKVTIGKNKTGGPAYRSVMVDLLNRSGFDTVGELVDLGVLCKIVRKSGAWLYIDEQKFQGREAFRQALIDIPGFKESLIARIMGDSEVTEEIVTNEPELQASEELEASIYDDDGVVMNEEVKEYTNA